MLFIIWKKYYTYSDTSVCFPEPCKNGATCVDSFDSYICQCVAGYVGDDCEHGNIIGVTILIRNLIIPKLNNKVFL